MREMISNIVFTKNRPLQLEAYLYSLYCHIPQELVQTYILYKADLFGQEYSELFKRFSNCVVITEQDFHDDLIALIEQIDTEYILFGTDDVVYFESVNFHVIDETFGKFPKEIFGFSLRLDPDSLRVEKEAVIETTANGETIYSVKWKNAKSSNAMYPFEINSTIYRTPLVKEIVSHISKGHPMLKRMFPKRSVYVKFLSRLISMKDFLASLETFNNPNTLEGYCYRWCRTHKHKLPSYLYFQKACASAIQVNTVNAPTSNPIDGLEEHTVESLNEKYKQGYRFDIEAIEKDRPIVTHIGREYFKLVRRA